MSDPDDPPPPVHLLDKLIAAFQGVTIKDPVPTPAGASQITVTSEQSPVMSGVLLLWYRQIIRHVSGYSKTPGDALSDWEYLYVKFETDLSVMNPKQRENAVIEIAGKSEIGHYPRVLYAFEWYDTNLGKPLRQEIKDGFVRG